MSDIKLKRCPFCGRKAKVEHKDNLETWIVECSNGMCPASYMIGMDYDTEQEAIEVWNRRYYEADLGTPTIDAVSVVRCKECRYWHSGECWGIPYRGDYDTSIDTKADDYCSYGERSDT